MDGQDYVNKFNPNGDFIDKSEPENYPSENEIISSQNDYNNNNSDNTNNTPNQNNNYCPPPIPSEVYHNQIIITIIITIFNQIPHLKLHI